MLACYLICSYFLYEISHPDKAGAPQIDLSGDVEACIDALGTPRLAPCQEAIERVISKVFSRYKCDVVITDRLRSVFTLKLWRMGKSHYSLGSTARSKIYKKWKKTMWTVELREDEVIPSSKKRKSGHGNENLILHTKKLKVAEDLKVANKKLKDITKEYQTLRKSCKTLSAALKDTTNEGTGPSHTRTKKAWELCTKQYQNKRTQEMAQNINALCFTEDENFKPVRVEILNKSTGNKIVCIDHDGELKVTKDNKQCCNTNETVVDQALYIKDKFNISNQAYHEMAMVNKELPRSCTLLKTAKNIDAECIIRSTPGQLKGVQVSLKEKLQRRIKYLAENYPKYQTSQCVKIKLTGDGTNISRSVHLVVIAFTIIDSGTDHIVTSPNSPTGNCSLALINTTEGYDNLSEALEDIIDEVKHLHCVIVDGVSYDLQYFFCADMKFLAICMGIEAANSAYGASAQQPIDTIFISHGQ